MNLFEVLKALANPTRVDMLRWLKDTEQYFGIPAEQAVDGINAGQFEQCGLSQSTVSAHLTTLHRAGLLVSTRSGQKVLYRRNEDAIAQFRTALNNQL